MGLLTRKHLLLLGTSLVTTIATCLIIAGSIRVVETGWTNDNITYFGQAMLLIFYLATVAHLWSRLPLFDKGMQIRKLFFMMGFSFITISSVYILLILDHFLSWAGFPTISWMFDNAVEPVQFFLFGNESFPFIQMSAMEVGSFSQMILGVAFYVYPLERHVKDRKPWFTMSLLVTVLVTISMGFLPRDPWLLSITTLVGVGLTFVNFVYMFYLYFSMAVRSSGKMRKASFMVAFGLLIIFFVWFAGIFDIELHVKMVIQYSIGGTSLILFNAGFFVMTIGVENKGGLATTLLEYYQSKRICIVHRGTIKDRVYACPGCGVYYCVPCKNAVVDAENKCWNCGTVLEKSMTINIQIKADDHAFDDFKELKQKLGQDSDLEVLKLMIGMTKKYMVIEQSKDGNEAEMNIEITEPSPAPEKLRPGE
ncbi:MAG: hypothetical protein ACFFCS_26605 [Candidatus Hodarchaeota archaeon]